MGFEFSSQLQTKEDWGPFLNMGFRQIIALSIGLAQAVKCGTLKPLGGDNHILTNAEKGRCQ